MRRRAALSGLPGLPVARAASILALAGCASVQPAALDPQVSAAGFEARSFEDDGLRRFATAPGAGLAAWPPDRLDARALEVAAIYFNPALNAARSKSRVAAAAIAAAGEIPNPTFSVSPLYVTTATAGVSPWVVAASLAQIVETAGKRQFRLAKAKYVAEAARLDALAATWETVGQVDGALLDVAVAQDRRAALKRLVAADAGLEAAASKRLQAGLGSRLEVAAVQMALTKATLDQQSAEASLIEARHRLAQAVGVSVDALPFDRVVPPSPAQPLPPGFAERVRDTAALDRADLLARLADYAASAIGLQLEVASRIPNIELGPNFEYDQGDRKWGFAATFQIPVFNQNQGPIAEAAAQLRHASDQFVAAQAGVIGEVDRAVASYNSAVKALSVADRLSRQQARQEASAQALFAGGETDRLDLLAARAEAAAAALGLIEAQTAVGRARLAVELAGNRFPDGIDPVTLALPAQD